MADKQANIIVNLVDKASSGLSNITGKFVAWGTAITAVVGFLKLAVEQAVEQEKATQRLNLALKNQGIFTEALSRDLHLYATRLAQTTAFSDDLILETLTLLTTFGLAGVQLKQTTIAALDLSKGLGIDLRTATLALGKVAIGETSPALAKLGIRINENIPIAERFDDVLRQLNEKVGGSAQADLKTTIGQWENLKNRFFELAESVGVFLIPVLQGVIIVLREIVRFFEIWVEFFGEVKDDIMEIAGVQQEVMDQQAIAQTNFEQKTKTHLENLKVMEKKNLDDRAKQRKAFLEEQEAMRKNKASVEDKIEDELKKKHDDRLEARKTIYGTVTEQIRGIASSNAKATFIAEKAFAISTAIINTAVGATASLRYGWPMGPILAGIISALGAAQVGVIASQTVAGLAEGGLVLPTPGGTIARIGEAGSAEAVIPLDDDRAAGMLGGTTVNIYAGTIVADEVSVREFARRIDEELFALNRNRQSVALG